MVCTIYLGWPGGHSRVAATGYVLAIFFVVEVSKVLGNILDCWYFGHSMVPHTCKTASWLPQGVVLVVYSMGKAGKKH